MNDILHAVNARRVTDDRHYLHAHPGVAFDLQEAFDYVWQQLKDMGLEPHKCGKCGIYADIGAGEKCVLLRADMDALPIREEAEIPFASVNEGSMHACGHDTHTAMLLEAARVLKGMENGLGGKVRLMFQPAEEPLLGASDMLANGLLADVKPCAAFMIHVLTNMPLPAGTVIVSSPGVSAPAAGMFEIRIQGKGCHGAMPNMGVDPITIAAHTVLNLQQIQTRELSLNQACALTIGMCQAGDTANVIPDKALLRGSLRAFDDDAHQHLIRRVKEISEQTAAMFGGSAQVEMLGGCPTLVNNETVSRNAYAALSELLGKEHVVMSHDLSGGATKSSGSEDFANITHECPSVMIALAAGEPGKGYNYPAHHPRTLFDESVLPAGAAVYAALAADALKR